MIFEWRLEGVEDFVLMAEVDIWQNEGKGRGVVDCCQLWSHV